jgi:hypothetical protein
LVVVPVQSAVDKQLEKMKAEEFVATGTIASHRSDNNTIVKFTLQTGIRKTRQLFLNIEFASVHTLWKYPKSSTCSSTNNNQDLLFLR